MTEPTPNIQAILASLAQFAPPAQPPQSANGGRGLETPGNVGSTPLSPPGHQSVETTGFASNNPLSRPQSRSTGSPKPTIDPATITTWQDGLRCVTKIAAQNSQFAASIRRMMADQRKNELRWFSERQALKHTQANRAQSFSDAQSILQSLNKGTNGAPTTVVTSGVVDSEKELSALDRKIYSAQQDMEAAMVSELKALGVPFFGTDRSLISSDEDVSSLTLEDQPKWSPVITDTQLMGLRKRMVGHLEDLYRD